MPARRAPTAPTSDSDAGGRLVQQTVVLPKQVRPEIVAAVHAMDDELDRTWTLADLADITDQSCH